MAEGLSVILKYELNVAGEPLVRNEVTFSEVLASGVDRMSGSLQEIGTTEEAIDLGDVAAGGVWLIVNIDSTNFVSIRDATGTGNLIRIDPGEFTLFRLDDAATAPFAIADTAAVKILKWATDD